MSTESSSQVHKWRAFAVLAVSYFMTIVDLTIVNVALPTIGRDRNLHTAQPQRAHLARRPDRGSPDSSLPRHSRTASARASGAGAAAPPSSSRSSACSS